MNKKKLFAVLVSLALIIAIIIGAVALVDHRKSAADNKLSETGPATLYGDINAKENDNVDQLTDEDTMLTKVCHALEAMKENGTSKTALTLKETVSNQKTVYTLLSDKKQTAVFFTFEDNGPVVHCNSKEKNDVALFEKCAAVLIYVSTPSVGKYEDCAKTFAAMKNLMSRDGTTVNFNQNYTEFTYHLKDGSRTFAATAAKTVG